MVFSRQLAVDYLKRATLCNGLVLEYRGMAAAEGFQRVFVMNQCGLVATALKMVGDSSWTLIRDMITTYLQAYSYYGADKLRNYFYPIIDQAVIPIGIAFKPGEERILYDAVNVGDDEHPKQIILHWENVDPLSDTCGDIRLNRALMRAIHHWNLGQTSIANTCYDFVLANRRPEAWHLADDDIDFDDGGIFAGVWKYRTYKQIIQWIAAQKMGRTKLHTDVLDMTQETTPGDGYGGIRTFYKTNYTYIHSAHNTETTALAVIADKLWNP